MSNAETAKPILDWAFRILGGDSPPVQNVVAFVVILLLAAPLVRSGWREFKKPPPPPDEVIAHITVDPGWLYTMMVNIELQLQDMNRRLTAIEKLLHRRARKN